MTSRDQRHASAGFTRREALTWVGAAGSLALVGPLYGALGAAQAEGTCVVRPEQTEGPYFVDRELLRSDLRSDPQSGAVRPGVPLQLEIAVARLAATGACAPLPGALVDVWHCDADGIYSGVRDDRFDTRDAAFLRGQQKSDADGVVRFTTIYPGWYPGRAVHIHFKVRAAAAPGTRGGEEFTSQLYFDDAFSDRVYAREPYAARRRKRTRNDDDGLFVRDRGPELVLAVAPSGPGYAARFALALET
jgi:protocatechuate 3,4-dioxygenase beta subunit